MKHIPLTVENVLREVKPASPRKYMPRLSLDTTPDTVFARRAPLSKKPGLELVVPPLAKVALDAQPGDKIGLFLLKNGMVAVMKDPSGYTLFSRNCARKHLYARFSNLYCDRLVASTLIDGIYCFPAGAIRESK